MTKLLSIQTGVEDRPDVEATWSRGRRLTATQSLHGKSRADRNALTIDQRGVCCGIEAGDTSVPAERHVTAEVISYGTLPALAAWILVELSGIESLQDLPKMSSELSRLCVRVVAQHLRGMRIRILVFRDPTSCHTARTVGRGWELSCGAGRTA
jgi:hypothetical protein